MQAIRDRFWPAVPVAIVTLLEHVTTGPLVTEAMPLDAVEVDTDGMVDVAADAQAVHLRRSAWWLTNGSFSFTTGTGGQFSRWEIIGEWVGGDGTVDVPFSAGGTPIADARTAYPGGTQRLTASGLQAYGENDDTIDQPVSLAGGISVDPATMQDGWLACVWMRDLDPPVSFGFDGGEGR